MVCNVCSVYYTKALINIEKKVQCSSNYFIGLFMQIDLFFLKKFPIQLILLYIYYSTGVSHNFIFQSMLAIEYIYIN